MRDIQYTIADKEPKPTENEKQAWKKDKLIERYKQISNFKREGIIK